MEICNSSALASKGRPNSGSEPRLPASVAGLAVHEFPERLAVEEAAEVVGEEARDEQVTPRMRAADMRQDDDSLGAPESMLRGQRFLAKHVEQGAGNRLRL